jgi:hypothetical protein
VAAARDPRASARGLLRRGPILLPAAAAIGVLVYLVVVKDAGTGRIPIAWQVCTLFLLALLFVSLLLVPGAGGPPRPVLMAAGLLAAYAAWSYASIAWADQTADALDGANRTTLYAVVFGLFALWPLGRRGAALILSGLVLAIGATAILALLKIDAAGPADIDRLFVGGRLGWPVNYPNGGVVLWFMAFWPSVLLASRRELHPLLRGLFVALAVVFTGTALLAQSRGWLFALPIVTVAFLVIAPGRVRVAWTLLGVGLTTLVIARSVLDVLDAFGERQAVAPEIDQAVTSIVVAALLAGAVGAGLAYLDRRTRVSAATAQRTGRAMAVGAAVVVLLGAGAFVVRVGDPVSWTDARWQEFKGGPQPNPDAGARFTQTLGSNRYDFWRVAWNDFERHPLTGVGADNFRHDYLKERRSSEEAYYPHSLVIRTLSQTGLVGAVLLFGAIGCALAAAAAAIRERPGLPGAVAAGAATGFVYFLVHGAVDWFWELPAIGGLAFALLGLAAGLHPRAALHPRVRRAREPLVRAPAALGAATLVGAALLVALLPPLLGDLATKRARDTFNEDPARAAQALDQLDSAARLRRGSVVPRLFQAQIVTAVGHPELAAPYYRDAIRRDPRDVYVHTALAAVESTAGHRTEAERNAAEAVRLSPRDTTARRVLRRLRAGRRVTIYDVNKDYAARVKDRGR